MAEGSTMDIASEPAKNGHNDEDLMEEIRNSVHQVKCETAVFGRCLHNQFLKLYDNALFSDVRIQLKNGQIFNGHKTILASSSKKFMELLSSLKSDNPREACTLNLAGYDQELMQLMLRLIYEGKASVPAMQVLPLLQLASEFDINPIKDLCGEILFEQQKANIGYLLDISKKYNVKQLETLCANHFADHFSDLMSDSPEQLMKLDVSTWVEVLKKDKVEINTEQMLYEVTIDYILKKFPKPGKERDEVFNLLLPLIRFSVMPVEYLVNKVEPSELLQHLPIKKDLLFTAYRWKCLPPSVKSIEMDVVHRYRQTSKLLWSPTLKNPLITMDDSDCLSFTASPTASYQSIRTTTGFKGPGRYYFEINIDVKGTWLVFGICDDKFDCSTTQWVQSYRAGNTWLYHHDYGAFWKNGVAQPKVKAITPITAGSAVGVIVDFDEGKIIFTLNGIPQGDPMDGIPNDAELFPFVTAYQQTKVSINVPPKYPL